MRDHPPDPRTHPLRENLIVDFLPPQTRPRLGDQTTGTVPQVPRTRLHDVAQVVHLGSGHHALLDVRRTRNGVTRPTGPGLDVAGGRLSRSAENERAHYAVLEAAAFVVYGIPGVEDDVDAVATTLSRLTAELA